MKRSLKITFSALMAALAAVVMTAAYFPYATYAVPAAAGMFIMVALIELGAKWAWGGYAAAAAAVFLFAEPEAKLLFIALFGYYPIVKALIERLRKRPIEWLLKLLIFNAAVIAVYRLFALVIDIQPEEFSALGQYGSWLLLLFGNFVFVVYDIALSRMAALYVMRLHPTVHRIIHRK